MRRFWAGDLSFLTGSMVSGRRTVASPKANAQLEISSVNPIPFFFSSRRRHMRSLCDWSSDVCSSDLGPDGALYFIDWQNPIIGHMQHNLRDPSRDREHGRIYRITYEGRDPLKPTPIASQPTEKRSEERRVGKEGRS